MTYKFVRTTKGRFSKWDYKKIGRIVFAIIAIVICVKAYGYGKPVEAYKSEVVKVVENDSLSKKIDQLKWEAVDKIKACESAGHEEEDGIIIFDSNNKASIGQLQWQKLSVIHYYKTLYNQEINAKEAVMIALDTEKARKLAYDVIFKDSKGWRNWYNCGVKTKIETQLEIIKKLEA